MKIPRRVGKKWDGDSKYLTSSCLDCNFYRSIDEQKLCGYGTSFKYLVIPKENKLRKCAIKTQKPFFGHSIDYLDKILFGENSNGK